MCGQKKGRGVGRKEGDWGKGWRVQRAGNQASAGYSLFLLLLLGGGGGFVSWLMMGFACGQERVGCRVMVEW